jgi:hypothetical protein
MAVIVQVVILCFVTSCSLVDGCDVSLEYFNPEDGGSVFPRNSAMSVYKTFTHAIKCVGVLISLWLFLFPIFLFAAQPKEIFLDQLKKLEQRSHKCVELRGGICRVNTFFQSCNLLFYL